MSRKVKERLDRLELETTHEERREIDRVMKSAQAPHVMKEWQNYPQRSSLILWNK